MKIRAHLPIANPAVDFRPAIGLTILCLGLAFCARASATVINTYPDWDGGVTLSYSKVAQSFLAPADGTLASWQFTLAPRAGATNLLFEIVRWDPSSGPNGAPLFSRQVNWPALGGNVRVDNIDLTLAPNTRYAAVVDLEGYAGQSVNFQYNQNSYDQGNASWFASDPLNPGWKYLNSSYNTEFRAEFYAVPEPASLLGLGLASAALASRAKRRDSFRTSQAGPERTRVAWGFV